MRYGKLFKVICTWAMISTVLAGCGSQTVESQPESETGKSVVISETAEDSNVNDDIAEPEAAAKAVGNNPYNIRTEIDDQYIWYMAPDGIHQFSRTDSTDKLFLESEGITTLYSWQDWLYITDSTLQDAGSDNMLEDTVWKVNKQTGELTDTGVKASAFDIIGDTFWKLEITGEYSDLEGTDACHYEGYTLNSETGDPEGEPTVLQDFGFGHTVLSPASEVYDYLVMGDDYSKRLLWKNDGTVMGSIVIEDIETGEYETVTANLGNNIYYGGNHTFVYNDGEKLNEYHTDSGETRELLSGYDGQVFSADENYIYLFAYTDDLSEPESSTLILSRISRDTGEQEDLLTITNGWDLDPMNGRSGSNSVYVGDIVDGKFFYYDSESGQIVEKDLD